MALIGTGCEPFLFVALLCQKLAEICSLILLITYLRCSFRTLLHKKLY